MGCPKLTYYDNGMEALRKNFFFTTECLEKKVCRRKNRLDYYPFGMPMPGRTFSSDQYRYGFNGMEKDDEMGKGDGNSYDFGARLYDPRLGRWLSLDPLARKYPSMSPYIFTGNNPVLFVDYDGKDYGVKVTHTKTGGTIIIKATVYAVKADMSRAKDAAGLWNDTKNYAYQVTDNNGKISTYKVEFQIDVQESYGPVYDAEENPEGNSFQIMPEASGVFTEDVVGKTTDQKYAIMNKEKSSVGGDTQLQADGHEVGHFLKSGGKVSGESHSSDKGDLMYKSLTLGGLKIGKGNIQNILKAAGIGGNDSPNVSSTVKPNITEPEHSGSVPENFYSGKVIETK